MVEFREFMLSDLYAIDIQERHVDVLKHTIGSTFSINLVLASTRKVTALHKGRVIACFGVSNDEVWAFLARDIHHAMTPLLRFAYKWCMTAGRPLRAHVDKDHPAAVRLVKLFGFSPTTHGYWIFDRAHLA